MSTLNCSSEPKREKNKVENNKKPEVNSKRGSKNIANVSNTETAKVH